MAAGGKKMIPWLSSCLGCQGVTKELDFSPNKGYKHGNLVGFGDQGWRSWPVLTLPGPGQYGRIEHKNETTTESSSSPLGSHVEPRGGGVPMRAAAVKGSARCPQHGVRCCKIVHALQISRPPPNCRSYFPNYQFFAHIFGKRTLLASPPGPLSIGWKGGTGGEDGALAYPFPLPPLHRMERGPGGEVNAGVGTPDVGNVIARRADG
jgi:hypothetical protein